MHVTVTIQESNSDGLHITQRSASSDNTQACDQALEHALTDALVSHEYHTADTARILVNTLISLLQRDEQDCQIKDRLLANLTQYTIDSDARRDQIMNAVHSKMNSVHQ